jgi:hypothetical protein
MTAKNNNVCKKNVTREVLINGFSIRSPTYCLRKRETPARHESQNFTSNPDNSEQETITGTRNFLQRQLVFFVKLPGNKILIEMCNYK